MKPVKYVGVGIGFWWGIVTIAQAQPDSGKIVQLQNVTVVAAEKTTTTQLANFYKANGAATLDDVLSRLPEISMLRRGNYGMEPSIRSMNGGQINVLIDGMKMHGACTDKMDPATTYIEPINLENLQLQTSTQGFAKGSAIGGTLDMKMAEPVYAVNGQWHGQLTSGYQSVSQGWYTAAALQSSHQRWAWRGSATFRSHRDYTDGNGNKVPFSGYHKTNFSLSVKHALNDNTWLKADLLTDDGWDIGYAALPMDVGSAKARIASLSMEHNNQAKRLYALQAKLYINSVHHQMDDSKRPDVHMHMDMPGISKTWGMYAEAKARLRPKQWLQIRVDAASTFLTASMTMYPPNEVPMYMLTWPSNRRNQLGASAVWQWKPDSVWNLRLTARLDGMQSVLTTGEAKDHVAITGGNTHARYDLLKNISVAGSRNWRKGWYVNMSAGYAERMPTASELFGFYLYNAADGYDYIGQTNLQCETALNAEASMGQKLNRIKWQLTGFYSYVQHQIVGQIDADYSVMTPGAKGVKVYENLSYAHVMGAEASLQWKLQPEWACISTLRYTRATASSGEPLPFIAPLKSVSSLRFAPNKFWAQLEYEASLPQKRVSKSFGEKPASGFILVHARAGYTATLLQTSMTLQAGVENIFDTAYKEHLDWGTVLRPGRNVYVQVKCSF